MDDRIIERIDELKADRLHGAGWMTRHAVETLLLTTEYSEAANLIDFLKELVTVADQIKETRISVMSIANYIHLYLQQIKLTARKTVQVS